MPSLLQKLSYFDPDTGNTFVVASDGFYWKEGKKAPEDSKVTRLLQSYGWRLHHGSDAFLIFKQKGNSGDVFVVRGNKRWFYELRDESGDIYGVGAKGKGLDELQAALDKGLLDDSMEKAAASPDRTTRKFYLMKTLVGEHKRNPDELKTKGADELQAILDAKSKEKEA